MEHGELFAKLRSERRISQESLARGISTRSAVAAFEYRHTNLSLNYGIGYLDRMNITLGEYMYLFNEHHLSKKRELTQLLFSPKQKQAIPLIEKEYAATQDIYYDFLLLEIELMKVHQQGLDFSRKLPKPVREKVKKIKQHLDRVETWGRFELSMFTNCCFVFETDYLVYNLETSLEKMKDYQEKTYQSQFWGTLLHNCLVLALHRKSDSLLQATFQQLKDYQPKQTDFLSCLLGRFLERIFDLEPQAYHGDSELLLLLQTLELFDLADWSDLLREYYDV